MTLNFFYVDEGGNHHWEMGRCFFVDSFDYSTLQKILELHAYSW